MKIDLEERVARAKSNFKSGYNCSQSVALAYSDLFDIDTDLMATISAPFGGGMGRMREVCGAVSGMTLIAGLLSPANDVNNQMAKAANYTLVREFADSFRHSNGSIICRELLGLNANEDSTHKRKPTCAELVATAARIVGEYIIAQEEKS